MKTITIIPARIGSVRLPGKPLIKVKGKPIIQYVWENISTSEIDFKIIATDDEKIAEVAQAFGAEVMLTSSDHQNGSERCSEVLKKYPDYDIVLNIQGDEPMVNNRIITALLQPFKEYREVEVTTLKSQIDTFSSTNPNVVKVVTDQRGFALYFSRSVIPHVRDPQSQDSNAQPIYKHLGFYGFRKQSLLEYIQLAPSPLEKSEKLEQLRLLENGKKVFVNECHEKLVDINTESDVEQFRELLEHTL